MTTYQADDAGMAMNELGETIPFTPGKPRLFNGQSIFEFETMQEMEEYLSQLPVMWSKEAHCAEINSSHNAKFRELFTERNYITMSEILMWVDDAEFGAEAQALIAWWVNTCKLVAEYCDNVTEQTVNENFIDELPQLQIAE